MLFRGIVRFWKGWGGEKDGGVLLKKVVEMAIFGATGGASKARMP